MRCQRCGKMLDNTVKVCPVCGEPTGLTDYVSGKTIQQDISVQQYNGEPRYYADNDMPLQQQYSDQPQTYIPQTDLYNSYPRPVAPPQRQENAATKSKGKSSVLLIISVIIILVLLVLVVILLMMKSNNGNDNSSNVTNAVNSSSETEKITTTQETTTTSNTTAEPTTTTTTTATTTNNTTTTKETTTETTTALPEDARKNNYIPFDTVLVVRADEVDTLPLRSEPNKSTSQIIKRIPDGTSVHVLGFRDLGSEVWFRVNYDDTLGWCRGGMLQPNNLGMLSDNKYNISGLEKWKIKFQIQTPNSTSDYGTASFKGTLYFLPDLSSGVQKRFKSKVTVNVTAKQGEWYYVEFYSDEYYNGWVHSSFLSF